MANHEMQYVNTNNNEHWFCICGFWTFAAEGVTRRNPEPTNTEAAQTDYRNHVGLIELELMGL